MTEAQLQSTATTDPGALLKESFQVLLRPENAVPLLLGAVIMTFGSAFSLGICAGPLILGFTTMCQRVARGETVQVGDIGVGFSRFGASFVLMLLVGLAVFVGLILLVLPGLIAGFFLAFSFQELAGRPSMAAVDAMKGSVTLVKENLGTVAIAMLIAFAVTMVLAFIPVVGSLVGSAFSTLFFAMLYLRIRPGAASAF